LGVKGGEGGVCGGKKGGRDPPVEKKKKLRVGKRGLLNLSEKKSKKKKESTKGAPVFVKKGKLFHEGKITFKRQKKKKGRGERLKLTGGGEPISTTKKGGTLTGEKGNGHAHRSEATKFPKKTNS